MNIEKLDINAVCFGILCNFTPVCGEERAKEAVELVRTLQVENDKLRAELEQVKQNLKYYLEVNEENGVVYIPKFMIEKMVRGLEEG